jgi:hypothetical protein
MIAVKIPRPITTMIPMEIIPDAFACAVKTFGGIGEIVIVGVRVVVVVVVGVVVVVVVAVVVVVVVEVVVVVVVVGEVTLTVTFASARTELASNATIKGIMPKIAPSNFHLVSFFIFLNS